MRFALLAILMGLTFPVVAAPPTSAPATKPLEKQKVKLFNGSVRIFLPSDWQTSDVAQDGMTGKFIMPDGKSYVVVNVSQQDRTLSKRAAQVVKMTVIEGLNKQFAEQHTEVLTPPTYEQDDRFFTRIHDRIKVEGQVLDELHIFRMEGLNLLCITAVIFGDTPRSARPMQKAAEDMALDIQVGYMDTKQVPKKK